MSVDYKNVFVAMPFNSEFENTYDFGIRLSLEARGFIPIRTDKRYFIGVIMDEIQSRIRKSSFIIADISDSNPNVLFELGFALACDKPSVVICRRGNEIPFDVSGVSIIIYDPMLLRELKNAMDETLNVLTKRINDADN